MRYAKAFDIFQLWVILDGPSSLGEDFLVYFYKEWTKPIDTLASSADDNSATQFNGGFIGRPEDELARGDPTVVDFECDLFDRASRILMNDFVP